ncbi:MAG: response regulator [Spirochaetales bacterium]|nr:response regulator [Spirochaetales bacterium]
MNELFNLKLLYVEDEPETRLQMEKFLKRRFSRVVTASDGNEGLLKFKESKPDIIIADLLMEGLGGIQMIEKIRETGANCPVLITSALEDTGSILKTVELGIDRYIIKPIDTEDLSQTLEKIAARILKDRGSFLQVDIHRKKEVEKELRLEISAFLKKKTGKGPKSINVFLGSNNLEIGINGFLTPFDESLLEDRRNQTVVEQNRRLFYKTVKKELEDVITGVISIKTEMSELIIDSGKNRESFVFKY